MTSTAPRATPETDNPWPALWAMVIGFFMILVDSTIVSVATPAMQQALDTDYNTVLWVTSSYLLAYAVPLLITGRLGDRFGPKRVYLVGLALFTAASLWCGLTSTIEMLVVARVAQGLGASMMTPQTMAVITRTFPADRRGRAMSLWGAIAGLATLVGPVLGGVLVQYAGWEWIFIVNVPVGIVGFVLAWRLVPTLTTQSRRFDWLGVLLSGVSVFLVVFGIQEGSRYDWGTINGPVTVPRLIVTGLVLLAVFVWWQHRQPGQPLVPLNLFKDRNFSVGSIAIALVAFSVTAMAFPFMLWAQSVRDWSPVQAGSALIPMAIVTAALAPIVGRLTDRINPRLLTSFGFAFSGAALLLLAYALGPNTPTLTILTLFACVGVGNAFLWAPIGAAATRNLPLTSAGAGAGIYNTTRQVGAVLGSAAIAAAIESRLTARLPEFSGDVGEGASAEALEDSVKSAFTSAMADAILVPAIAFLIGAVVVQLFARTSRSQRVEPGTG